MSLDQSEPKNISAVSSTNILASLSDDDNIAIEQIDQKTLPKDIKSSAFQEQVLAILTRLAHPESSAALVTLREKDGHSLRPLYILLRHLQLWDNSIEYAGSYRIILGYQMQYLDYDRSVSDVLQLMPSATSSLRLPQDQPQKTLLDLIDLTVTRPGRSLLQSWLQHPLRDLSLIEQRQSFIRQFMSHPMELNQLRDDNAQLKQFPDLRKAIYSFRVVAVAPTALRDMLDVYRAILRSQNVIRTLRKMEDDLTGLTTNQSERLQQIVEEFNPYLSLIEEVVDADHIQAINNSSSGTKRNKSLFREKFIRIRSDLTPALQSLYDQVQQAEQFVVADREAVIKIVGVDQKEFHLEYSEIHGWHYRVTKRLSAKVLKALDAAKQPYNILSNQKAGTLFATRKLESLLKSFDRHKQSYEAAQEEVISDAVGVAKTYLPAIQNLCDDIANIDAHAALACLALEKNWVMPKLVLPTADQDCAMMIKSLRHPLLEEQVGSNEVIANDITFPSSGHGRVKILTGPNMGGKSTYLKSIATAAILAQIGSCLPASSMESGEVPEIPIFDRIFIRSGSTDNTTLGLSTFMAEMLDVSEMLRSATSQSLVLIDEVGRGTSTSDGFGLAWAILEELKEIGCRAICATHFHELSVLSSNDTAFENLHVEAHVDIVTKEIAMLYKVEPGGSDRSYGVHCAEIAGFPQEIIAEAREIEERIATSSSHYVQVSRKRLRDDES